MHIRVYPKAAELNRSNKASKPEESHFFTFGRLRREVPRFTSSDYPSVKLRSTPITILLGKPRIAYLSFLDDVRQRSAPAHGQLDTATSFLNPFPPRKFAASVANDRQERTTIFLSISKLQRRRRRTSIDQIQPSTPRPRWRPLELSRRYGQCPLLSHPQHCGPARP